MGYGRLTILFRRGTYQISMHVLSHCIGFSESEALSVNDLLAIFK